MSYIQKARAAEAFLTGRGIRDEDVLSLDISKGGVRMHLYGELLTGVSWEATEQASGTVHHYATVTQDGVDLHLVIVKYAEVAA